jgi:FkbM family methyltransferase
MKKFIKRFLYQTLGQSRYLKLLHASFFVLYDVGVLKGSSSFAYHHFVKNLIHKGDVVLDLGANLGYFSRIFSRLVGDTGKVICIEPVKPFFKTLTWALGGKQNCICYNYALGLEKKTIEMIVPRLDGYLRTGLAHIPSDSYQSADDFTFQVEMVKGSDLLGNLPQLNYIKCDIEGYERYVLPEIKSIIDKHKPILQIETSGDQKKVIVDLMDSLGYNQFSLHKNKLIKNTPDSIATGDYLFIHSSKTNEIIDKLAKKD